jgi:hypothetical protein
MNEQHLQKEITDFKVLPRFCHLGAHFGDTRSFTLFHLKKTLLYINL